MKTLFDPVAVGGRQAKNRLVRSATWERLADAEGRATPELLAVYEALARGGVGTVIVSATSVDPEGGSIPGQLGLARPEHVDGHRRIVDTLHAQGCLALAQFAFAGRDGALWSAGDPDTATLAGLPELFGRATVLARQAGYDGAQIHSAHGYFLSQFLNPATNARTDAYGGSPANARRLLMDIWAAMAGEAGEDFLLAVKLDCRDTAGTPGLDRICLETAKALDEAGIDLVEVSGLGGNKGICGGKKQPQSVFRREAGEVAGAVGAAVALVGANRSPEVMEEILAETDVALFALSRPLLREPDLPARWAAGDRRGAACVSCGKCYDEAGNGCFFTRRRPEA